jgi:transposase
MEAAAQDGVDAPTTGATGQRARRRAHRELGIRRLASDQKGALRRGVTLVFVDESGFSQKPSVRSTWAPRGCTPVIDDHVNWKRVSVTGAIAWRPKEPTTRLFASLRHGSIHAQDLVDFLRSLRRHIRGSVVVIWDGLSAHRSKVVRDYIAKQERWLRVEFLPPYAPELNPVEQMWANLCAREFANYAADDIDLVEARIQTGKRRMRRRDLGLTFIQHAGLLTNKQVHHLRKTH